MVICIRCEAKSDGLLPPAKIYSIRATRKYRKQHKVTWRIFDRSSCPVQYRAMNRDMNASRNIALCALHELNGLQRPSWLDRTASKNAAAVKKATKKSAKKSAKQSTKKSAKKTTKKKTQQKEK